MGYEQFDHHPQGCDWGVKKLLLPFLFTALDWELDLALPIEISNKTQYVTFKSNNSTFKDIKSFINIFA